MPQVRRIVAESTVVVLHAICAASRMSGSAGVPPHTPAQQSGKLLCHRQLARTMLVSSTTRVGGRLKVAVRWRLAGCSGAPAVEGAAFTMTPVRTSVFCAVGLGGAGRGSRCNQISDCAYQRWRIRESHLAVIKWPPVPATPAPPFSGPAFIPTSGTHPPASSAAWPCPAGCGPAPRLPSSPSSPAASAGEQGGQRSRGRCVVAQALCQLCKLARCPGFAPPAFPLQDMLRTCLRKRHALGLPRARWWRHSGAAHAQPSAAAAQAAAAAAQAAGAPAVASWRRHAPSPPGLLSRHLQRGTPLVVILLRSWRSGRSALLSWCVAQALQLHCFQLPHLPACSGASVALLGVAVASKGSWASISSLSKVQQATPGAEGKQQSQQQQRQQRQRSMAAAVGAAARMAERQRQRSISAAHRMRSSSSARRASCRSRSSRSFSWRSASSSASLH